jgi:hypothetical protein
MACHLEGVGLPGSSSPSRVNATGIIKGREVYNYLDQQQYEVIYPLGRSIGGVLGSSVQEEKLAVLQKGV